MTSVLKFLTVLSLFCAFHCGAKASDFPNLSLYKQVSDQTPAELKNRAREILSHRPYKPNVWPEIKLNRKSSSLFLKDYDVYEVEMPTFNKVRAAFETTHFKFYSPQKNNSAIDQVQRLVVIFPSIEGETLVERHLARKAIKAGHAVLIAHGFSFPFSKGTDAMQAFKEHMTFEIHGVFTFFDFIQHIFRNENTGLSPHLSIFKNILPDSISQIAISNGGGPAQYVAMDSRVSDQLLIVPVGNIPAVMATSDNNKIKPFREEQMRTLGLKDPVEFARYVRRVLEIDPIDLADILHSKTRTTIFTQTSDTSVPSVFQRELVNRYRTADVRAANIDDAWDRWFLNFVSNRIPEFASVIEKESAELDTHTRNKIINASPAENPNLQDFYDIGWGHVPKILSVAFFFDEAINNMLTRPTDPNSLRIAIQKAQLRNSKSLRECRLLLK